MRRWINWDQTTKIKINLNPIRGLEDETNVGKRKEGWWERRSKEVRRVSSRLFPHGYIHHLLNSHSLFSSLARDQSYVHASYDTYPLHFFAFTFSSSQSDPIIYWLETSIQRKEKKRKVKEDKEERNKKREIKWKDDNKRDENDHKKKKY